ncbi:DUF5362 family protein [Parapedobacter sp. 10938]|uniref:DUF5362 family protein n=1 Tax=Parapedobacter flavus TaxID=3110225 RepID=UPI002DB7A997|nr:DUF5362 family protein [Parapedobacter sp. 10938]MEC3880549.1 DUF5362 family protein [Parapedobacter sp. 10938]
MEENNHVTAVANVPPEPPLVINNEIHLFLSETAKWSKFLAIVGFIMAALIILAGIAFMIFGSAFAAQLPAQFAFTGMIGVIYAVMGLLYYFPAKYLYDFSTYAHQALAIQNQEALVYAFSKLKSFYKFWGIMMVIVLAVYGVALVFGVLGTLVFSAMN